MIIMLSFRFYKTIENWNDLFCHIEDIRLDITDGQCKNDMWLTKTIENDTALNKLLWGVGTGTGIVSTSADIVEYQQRTA